MTFLFNLSFQIWRLVTSVLYYPIAGPKGFHYLINLYFLYSYSTRLETGIKLFSELCDNFIQTTLYRTRHFASIIFF